MASFHNEHQHGFFNVPLVAVQSEFLSGGLILPEEHNNLQLFSPAGGNACSYHHRQQASKPFALEQRPAGTQPAQRRL